MLVTGGCGFIGANLVPRLLERGATVRVLDNLSRGSRDHLAGLDVELVEGDIRDADVVPRALDGFDSVVHLAASGSVVESLEDPFENFDVNARGTLVLLRACAADGVEKFVFASTGGALMGNTPPPVDETTLPWPISPYGASKLCGEAYCHAFAGSFGLSAVALRFANAYGPVSAHKKGAVTTFIKRALRGEPLGIYGDGTATRDFLYVDDLCDGISAAVDAPVEDDVVHLASGEETSIEELARLVLELTGATDVPIRYEHRRRGEVERTFATPKRAAELLGFAPSHSLRSGMQKTVEWFRAHAGG
ncbi:MAG TPA: NAD-dependent epimerase/dehydratase family protein [Gaiellaceae bacterium]|nr:NAD-dependent epimerase/dehydratase family protein [Gaiellaceae bacterium]